MDGPVSPETRRATPPTNFMVPGMVVQTLRLAVSTGWRNGAHRDTPAVSRFTITARVMCAKSPKVAKSFSMTGCTCPQALKKKYMKQMIGLEQPTIFYPSEKLLQQCDKIQAVYLICTQMLG